MLKNHLDGIVSRALAPNIESVWGGGS